MSELPAHSYPTLLPEHPGLAALFTEKGQQLLAQSTPTSPAEIEQWQNQARKEKIDPTLISALANQWNLKIEGKKKLGDWAGKMLFTRPGMEQSTRQIVAHYHAQIWEAFYRQNHPLVRTIKKPLEIADSYPPIFDLGCGLGVDSYALSSAGLKVIGVELDPDTAVLAAYNLREFMNTNICRADVHEILKDFSKAEPLYQINPAAPRYIYADPARRQGSERLFDPEQWSPSLSALLEASSREIDAFAIKLAPGVDYRYLPANAKANWVSVQGQLVEACLYSPNLIAAGGVGAPIDGHRWATVIDEQGVFHHYDLPDVKHANQPNQMTPAADKLDTYLWEPDPAVIRAGGISRLTIEESAAPISTGLAYLTAPTAPPAHLSALVREYRIVDVLPLKVKVVKQYLKQVKATRIDIKKRGVDLNPAEWRKQVLPVKNTKNLPPKTVTLVLTRVLDRHRCLVVEPPASTDI